MIRIDALLFGLIAAASAPAQDCSNVSIGLRPLDDQRTQLYSGFEGGLYPGGVNVRPVAHEAAGLAESARVTPLDANGNPSSTGRIVVASIGFSIAEIVFDATQSLAPTDGSIAASVDLVNCAWPMRDADKMADPNSDYWTSIVPALLAAAGVTEEQVQVVWILNGLRPQTEPFPQHVDTLEDYFVAIVQNVKTFLPNVRIGYVSSLPYMGYSLAHTGQEPYYFEQGFAQKRLIERQINGDPVLNWDPNLGSAVAPWLCWGPYLWCDGILPRSDGHLWKCEDVDSFGVHPSDLGADKIAERLLHFFRSDITSTPWYVTAGAGPSGRPADVELVGDGTLGSNGEPQLSVSTLPTIPLDVALKIQARHASAHGSGALLLGFSLLAPGGFPFGDGAIYVLPSWTIPLVFDGDGAGSIEIGAIPDDPAYYGIDGYAQLVSFDPGGWKGRFALSSAIQIQLGD